MLLIFFLTDFAGYGIMERDVLPYLEALMNETEKVDDWTGFDWGGKICFRTNHIMIVDEIKHKVGDIAPCLAGENGNLILNENNEWLEDTNYIEKHYSQFLKFPIKDFYNICQKWTEFLKGKNRP